MTFYFFSISFMFSFSQEDGDPGLVAFICSGLGEIKESDLCIHQFLMILWLAYFVFFQLNSVWYSNNIYSIQQK